MYKHIALRYDDDIVGYIFNVSHLHYACLTLRHYFSLDISKQILTYQKDVMASLWAMNSAAVADIVRYRQSSPSRCWHYTSYCGCCDESNRRVQLSDSCEEIAAVVLFVDETDEVAMLTWCQKMRTDSSVSNWSSSFYLDLLLEDTVALLYTKQKHIYTQTKHLRQSLFKNMTHHSVMIFTCGLYYIFVMIHT